MKFNIKWVLEGVSFNVLLSRGRGRVVRSILEFVIKESLSFMNIKCILEIFVF